MINIASVHGVIASAGKSAYVAAKHGVIGSTKVAALETARTGITVNAICPGWVLTPLVQQQIDALAAREGLTVEAASVKLLARSSLRRSSSRPRRSARWRCSCAPTPPARCAARN